MSNNLQNSGTYSKEYKSLARELARMGRILIYGSFNYEMKMLVSECLFIASRALPAKGKQWCTLHIDSGGGSVGVLTSIKSAMNESKLRFRGLVEYQAGSAGLLILQHCEWRQANTHSRFVFHYGKVGEDFPNEELGRMVDGKGFIADHITQGRIRMLNEVSARTGTSFERLNRLASEDRPLTAEEALDFGFIDEVISTIPSSVKPQDSDLYW